MVAAAGAVGWMIWFQWPTIFDTNSSTMTTNSSINSVTANQNTNTSTNANTNISPTASWKTYTDSTNRYTIQYPPDWTSTLNSTGPSFSGQGVAGKQFSTPIVTITTQKELFPKDPCLTGQTTIKVNGIDRVQQIEGCSYAAAEVATFFPYQDTHLVVSWTQDLPSAYDTYSLILSTFTFTSPSVSETGNWKTYTNSTYKYSFDHPKTLTLSAASPEYLTGIYVPSGDYRGYEEGLQELSVTVFDHRHGQSLIVGQYDTIREPKTLTIAGRDARWGITEVMNESSGAKVVISQLQFFGKEQDLVVRLTEDGTLTPIIAEQLFKSFVVADTPSTTESYALSCDGMTFTTNTALTKASWWKKFSSQIISGWTLDQACYNSALNQVVYEKSRTNSTGNGGALIGVYSIATDTFVKATPRQAIYGGECAGDITWNISTGIITYRCGSGDAGAYWYGVYTFNPVTQVNTKIKECSGDAETNKETCT